MSDSTAGRQRGGPPIGVVLAGGHGNRIGGEKATVELAGSPLIHFPLAAVEEAGLEPMVVAKTDTALPPLNTRVIREPDLPRHPLCGIVAALRSAAERPLVVVGCDMPFVSAALLAWLGSAREPLVVPALGGVLQPLPARYGPALLPALEAELNREAPLLRTVESLQPRQIAEEDLERFGEPRLLFRNVNTHEDLKAAERLLEPVDP